MNVLVVSQYYYPEPFRINELCEEFVNRGHNVTVLTANPNYPDGEIYQDYKNEYKFEIINGVNVYRIKCRPRHKGSLALALNYIEFCIRATYFVSKIDEKIDCVFSYQLSPITSSIPAIRYKKKNNVPMLLYCLDVWPESIRDSALDRAPFFKIIKEISKWVYTQADLLAISSPSFSLYLSDLCGLDSNDISFIPQHSKKIDVVNQVSHELSKYKEFVNFVFMGNIGESQDVECIIKAVSNIKDRSNFKIHIVGSGSYLNICKRVSKRLKTEDTVVFHGRRPTNEMPLYYSIADVCLVSLKDKGIVGYTIPGKLQEYMSAGKAILGCINGDAASVIMESGCGLCVNAGDDKKLAEKIQLMAKNKKCLKEYGLNAKKYYIKNFTLEVCVNKLEKKLLQLVEMTKEK